MARAPVLVVPLMAFINLLADEDDLLSGAPAVAAVAAGASLACTVGVTALRRLVAWNRSMLQWHLPLVIASGLFCAACVFAVAGSGWWIGCTIGVVMLWTQPRSLGATVFTMLGAIATWGLLFGALQHWPVASGSEWALIVTVLVASAMVVGTDLVFARVKRIPIEEARTSFASPAWTIGVAIVLAMAAAALRGVF